MRSFYGNFLALVRAWMYIRMLGGEGLRQSAALAVINANHLRLLLKEKGYRIPYDRLSMHEFVAQPPEGVKAVDLAKGLIELGFHPPPVYFPLIVKEALMVEPTETEAKETLEAFAEAMGVLLEKPRDWRKTPPTPPRSAGWTRSGP